MDCADRTALPLTRAQLKRAVRQLTEGVGNSALAIFVALVAAATLAVSEASACLCGGTTVEQKFSNADVVFSGIVVSIEWVEPAPGEEPLALEGVDIWQRISIDVGRVWKGTSAQRLTVYTGMLYTGTCSSEFQVGQPYLVFARFAQDQGRQRMVTTRCLGTTKLRGPGDPGYPRTAPPELLDELDRLASGAT